MTLYYTDVYFILPTPSCHGITSSSYINIPAELRCPPSQCRNNEKLSFFVQTKMLSLSFSFSFSLLLSLSLSSSSSSPPPAPSPPPLLLLLPFLALSPLLSNLRKLVHGHCNFSALRMGRWGVMISPSSRRAFLHQSTGNPEHSEGGVVLGVASQIRLRTLDLSVCGVGTSVHCRMPTRPGPGPMRQGPGPVPYRTDEQPGLTRRPRAFRLLEPQ